MEGEGDKEREGRREAERQRKVRDTCAALMCAVMDARTMINTSVTHARKEHTSIRQRDRRVASMQVRTNPPQTPPPCFTYLHNPFLCPGSCCLGTG